jgi:cystathionine beta-lyase/cystathionine gamma-synthase
LFEGFGGVMSFELCGGAAAASCFMEALQLAVMAPSLGGVETLVMRPAAVSHVNLSPQERAALGISDGLVRLAVGLEAVEDLIADLDRALRQVERRAAAVA